MVRAAPTFETYWTPRTYARNLTSATAVFSEWRATSDVRQLGDHEAFGTLRRFAPIVGAAKFGSNQIFPVLLQRGVPNN
jgi:hypothetical protein